MIPTGTAEAIIHREQEAIDYATQQIAWHNHQMGWHRKQIAEWKKSIDDGNKYLEEVKGRTNERDAKETQGASVPNRRTSHRRA